MPYPVCVTEPYAFSRLATARVGALIGTLILMIGPVSADEVETERLIFCGAEKVVVIDPDSPTETLWTWEASDSPEIPKEYRSRFQTTDDCKPYEGGWLLITSSSQGVALIERESKRCLFFAQVRNAHSACLLPGKQIAVASSTSGDEVQFFSQEDSEKPASAFHRIPLKGAHGTVWDGVRERLWAMGTDEILEIKSNASSDGWSVVARHPLPTTGGHDLSPAHDGRQLFVTTNTQVLHFDQNAGTFRVAEGFGDPVKIKSVDVHSGSKRIVFHQASPQEWWSHTIRFIEAPPVTLPEQRIYKVRWDEEAARP
ncbi:hypothetical protein FF011L_32480 [Roseimaritima multifibrata]|uniref:WD40-like Beta Propeller Repeat protein n=1 Tax=Roseimaritima multifibrata TaxID=1930274 RepID=A0A517MHW9_9BACT|nr:DUF6528 family protein [Roseimaritima multifibrata]QDS94469.1 hypothetical protein FF011L_32480 [Roseimaritima multifibrata]